MKPKKSKPQPIKRAGYLYFPVPEGGHAAVRVRRAADLCDVSLRTVARWRSSGRIPPACLRLLQLEHAGLIVPDTWAGAHFTRDGLLVVERQDPRAVFTRGELSGYWVLLQALREHERKARELPTVQQPMLVVIEGGRA